GELLSLTWDDVDFVGGIIFVRTSKSGEGRRIPMSPSAHRTLSILRKARQKRLRLRVVRQSEGSRYVFTAPQGGFLMNLNREWYGRSSRASRYGRSGVELPLRAGAGALERAGIADLHFHDLRHTFASRLVMAGVDLYRVQKLLGHKTPAMTQRYAHFDPEALKAAVATLD